MHIQLVTGRNPERNKVAPETKKKFPTALSEVQTRRRMGATQQKSTSIKTLIYVLLMAGLLLLIIINYLQFSHAKSEGSMRIESVDITEREDVNLQLHTNGYALHPLIFTITTFAYIDFVKNWVLSLERHKLYDFMIVCQDIKCKDALKKWRKSIKIELVTDLIEIKNDENEKSADKFLTFGTSDYITFSHLRPITILNVYLEYFNKFKQDINTKYNALLYLDSDMAIVENFIPKLQREYLYTKKYSSWYHLFYPKYIMYDIVLQPDNARCEYTNYFCGCFLFIPFQLNKIDKITLFMNEWENQIKSFKGDGNQLQMNMALNAIKKSDTDLNIGIVDCYEFPTGAFSVEWPINEYWNPFVANKQIQLVHANYVRGPRAKQDLLRKFNVWFLNDTNR